MKALIRITGSNEMSCDVIAVLLRAAPYVGQEAAVIVYSID
jgi:hypothetical protein